MGYYIVFCCLHHERFIGKRLKNFNVKFQHKTVEIQYDGVMKRKVQIAERMMAVLLFFMINATAGADKTKDANRALPYRGMRRSGNDSVFFVSKIENEDEANDTIEIKIKFNIPADPRTLQKQSIRINGKPLPSDAVLFFNKAGNKIKMLVSAVFIFGEHGKKDGAFYIDLPNAKSFHQISLYRSHFGDMRRNKEYTFTFSNKPQENVPTGKLLKEPPGEKQPAHYGDYLRLEEEN